jgi:hypothetical protein
MLILPSTPLLSQTYRVVKPRIVHHQASAGSRTVYIAIESDEQVVLDELQRCFMFLYTSIFLNNFGNGIQALTTN